MKTLAQRFRVIVLHLSFLFIYFLWLKPVLRGQRTVPKKLFLSIGVCFVRKKMGGMEKEGKFGGWYFPLFCVDKMGGEEKGRWGISIWAHTFKSSQLWEDYGKWEWVMSFKSLCFILLIPNIFVSFKVYDANIFVFLILSSLFVSSFSHTKQGKMRAIFSPFHFSIPLIKHSWWKISISSVVSH